jgi:hypothetical protein
MTTEEFGHDEIKKRFRIELMVIVVVGVLSFKVLIYPAVGDGSAQVRFARREMKSMHPKRT